MYTKYLLLVFVLLFVLPAKISKGTSFKTESEVTKNIQEKQIIDNISKMIQDFVNPHSEHNEHQQHDEKDEHLNYHFNRVRARKLRKLICFLIHVFFAFTFNLVILSGFPRPDQPYWFSTQEIHTPGIINKKFSPSNKLTTVNFDVCVKLHVPTGSKVFSTYVCR